MLTHLKAWILLMGAKHYIMRSKKYPSFLFKQKKVCVQCKNEEGYAQ